MSVLRKQTMSLVKNTVGALGILSSLSRDKKNFSLSIRNLKHSPNFRRSLPDYKTSSGSQYHPMSAVELTNNRIKDYLAENAPETFDDWDKAKSYLFLEIPHISDVNYSSIVMNTLLNLNNVKMAQSFLTYLQKSSLKPNVLAYLQYAALCGKNFKVSGQEEILSTFNKIQHYLDSTAVFDMKQGSYIIQGLCGTDKWRSAFKYLEKIPFQPTLEIRNSLASAAIRNGDEALAWEIISKWFKKGELLGNQVIEDFFIRANDLLMKDERKAESFLLKIFHHMESNNLQLTESTVKFVEKFFRCHSSDWSLSRTKVNRTGECDCCGKYLKSTEMTDTEFSLLEKNFLEKSLRKSDIFINTTADEFKKFISFIQRHKPFHIVIDGLNAAYTTKKRKNPKNLAIHLLQVVDRISSRSRKVLMLGRKHMSEWPPNLMRKIAQRSTVFLTSDITQDDPFTVYAALASGPNTFLLTLDLMRDHMARLDDPYLIALFKKWQQSHQVLLTVEEDNSFKFTEPVRHEIAIQGNMDAGWHVPYDDEILREPYEVLNNWLCIRRM